MPISHCRSGRSTGGLPGARAALRSGYPCKVPTIERRLLDSVIYLYKDAVAAHQGGSQGGSGFLVGVHCSQEYSVAVLAVTNYHVSKTCPVIRTSGPAIDRVINKVSAQWVRHPDGDDLAVTAVGLTSDTNSDNHLDYIPIEASVTPEDFVQAGTEEGGAQPQVWPFGPGEEVVMIGRFLGHDGDTDNRPAVRFGNIAIEPPVPFKHPFGFDQESYIIECRSASGYSGSPIFVFDEWRLGAVERCRSA